MASGKDCILSGAPLWIEVIFNKQYNKAFAEKPE